MIMVMYVGIITQSATGGQPERWNAGSMLWWIDSRGYDAYLRASITLIRVRVYAYSTLIITLLTDRMFPL